MAYWLMKTEPHIFSIEDLENIKISPWEGVRNYQARNYILSMDINDLIFIYHSSTKIIGIAGLAIVSKKAYPDSTALDPQSAYFDPKSSEKNPRWFRVDISFLEKYKHILTLAELRQYTELEDLVLLKKGSRLSVQPVSASHFQFISSLALIYK